MLVKLRTTLASPWLTAPAGSVVAVSDDMALSLVDGGYASFVEVPVEQVATAGGDSEQATIPKGRKK